MADELSRMNLFREVNGRIRGINERFGSPIGTYELLCECGSSGCTQRIEVPVHAYVEARSDAHRYLVVPGHERPRGDGVVTEGPTSSIVTVQHRLERPSGALAAVAQSA
jgi:hypothetical protein